MSRELIKKTVQPFLYELMRIIRPKEYLYYFNEYDNWDDAIKESKRLGGCYDNESILNRVDEATQRVRNGDAYYEQDGVCYNKKKYNWELLASLFYIKSKLSYMSVLDMGGALGSTWFRYRDMLSDVEWCVVEQKHFVDRGKKTVPEIDFFYSIDEAINSKKAPSVLLLSSVLSYLGDPYRWLNDMLDKKFKYIIIDENAFFIDENHSDKIVLQNVPKSIYSSVYPAYIFGYNKFVSFLMEHNYETIWEWDCKSGFIPIKKHFKYEDTIDRGFLLEKKE